MEKLLISSGPPSPQKILEIPSFNSDWKCHTVTRSVTCLLWDPASASEKDMIFHKPLEQPLNPYSAGLQCRASCPSCVMSVAPRVFHMSFTDTTLDKNLFVKGRTVCTNIHWHQVSHTTTPRKTPLLSVWIKHTLWGSPWVQVPSTPQILSQTGYLGPARSPRDTSRAVSSLPTWQGSLPAAVHTKSCHSLSRWLSTPKGHPWLGSCHFSRSSSWGHSSLLSFVYSHSISLPKQQHHLLNQNSAKLKLFHFCWVSLLAKPSRASCRGYQRTQVKPIEC